MSRIGGRCAYIPLLAWLAIATPAAASQERAPSPTPAGAEKTGAEDLDGKAKRLFVAGKYAEAIDILARLYTETGNPIYLRNIGRCYQRLRDVDRAIASFEEYLLRAKDLGQAERDEVAGFVRDLEDLKRRNAAAARPSPVEPQAAPPGPPRPPAVVDRPAAAPAPVPPPPTAPLAPPVATAPPGAAAEGLVPAPLPPAPLPSEAAAYPAPAMPADAPDVTARTWLPGARTMGIAAMALGATMGAVGGIVLASSWSKSSSSKKSCAGLYYCAKDAGDEVERRNRTAAILFIGTGVVGGAGLTVFLLNPGARQGRPEGIALQLGGRF